MTPRPMARLRWPAFGACLFLVLFWGAVLALLTGCRTADAADDPTWGRTYAVADSLVVPVSWAPACDALGCADSYRVTWTIKGTVNAEQPRNATGARLTPPSTTPALPTPLDVVIREVTITRPSDSVRVALPDIGLPRTVCVYVVAVRRGLASDARSACRTIEAPDAPPPAVDSIKWDSIGAPRITPPLSDSLHAGLKLLFGTYQYAVASDSMGDLWVDSLPMARGAGTDTMDVGYATVACGVAFLKRDSTPFVIVPTNSNATNAQLVRYRDRCGASAGRAYASKPPVRFFADSVVFRARSGTTVPAPLHDKGA